MNKQNRKGDNLTAHMRKIDQQLAVHWAIARALGLQNTPDPAILLRIRKAKQNKIYVLDKMGEEIGALADNKTDSPEVQVALIRTKLRVENEVVKDNLLAVDGDKDWFTVEDCLVKNQQEIAGLQKIRKALDDVERARKEAQGNINLKYSRPLEGVDLGRQKQIIFCPYCSKVIDAAGLVDLTGIERIDDQWRGQIRLNRFSVRDMRRSMIATRIRNYVLKVHFLRQLEKRLQFSKR